MNGYLFSTGKEECRGMVGVEEYLLLRAQAVKELSLGLHQTSAAEHTKMESFQPVQTHVGEIKTPLVKPKEIKNAEPKRIKAEPQEEITQEDMDPPEKEMTAEERFIALCNSIDD